MHALSKRFCNKLTFDIGSKIQLEHFTGHLIHHQQKLCLVFMKMNTQCTTLTT